MKLLVWGLSVLFHVGLLALTIQSEPVSTGVAQTTTGLTASREVSAARLIISKPPSPLVEKAVEEESTEPSEPVSLPEVQQATEPESEIVQAPSPDVVVETDSVATEPDVVAEQLIEPPVKAVQHEVQKPDPVVSKPKDTKLKSTQPSRLATPESVAPQMADASSTNTQPEQPQNARQASAGQQGDNTEKAGIAGQQEAENPAWDQYKTSVFAAINAQKRYPKQAKIRRIEGVVTVRFEIDQQGQVRRYEIIKKARSRYLNRSTNALFAGLHLPQPGASLLDKLPSTLTVPIKYSLN